MAKRSIKAMRRDELMDAAIAVIGEEGMANATMAVIARRAGMSAGLVNRYFQSKEELFKAVVRENISGRFTEWRAEEGGLVGGAGRVGGLDAVDLAADSLRKSHSGRAGRPA